MKRVIKPIIFVCLLAVFVILVVLPVKVSAIQLPGLKAGGTIPGCVCPEKERITCGCWLPDY